MWLFTKYGFFSVTQHTKRRDNIQIRARTDQDLRDLKDAFPPLDRCPIIETPDADYRWRLIVQRWKWEIVGAHLVADIDYGNFKGKIATIPTQREKGPMLHDIWDVHHRYQQRKHRPDPFAGHPELFRPHGDHLFDEDEMEGGSDHDVDAFRHMRPDDEGETVWQDGPEEDDHDPRWEDSRDSADDPQPDDDPTGLPDFLLKKPATPDPYVEQAALAAANTVARDKARGRDRKAAKAKQAAKLGTKRGNPRKGGKPGKGAA